MKQKSKIHKIPIKRAQELSERYGYPQVIILGIDEDRGIAAGASYWANKSLCEEASRLMESIFAEQGWDRNDGDPGGE